MKDVINLLAENSFNLCISKDQRVYFAEQIFVILRLKYRNRENFIYIAMASVPQFSVI